MRMNRHDYDLLYRIYSSTTTREAVAFEGQADKLAAAGCLTISNGYLHITEYGKAQMQRVRGVGAGTFKVPKGFALVPTKPTPAMLEAARRYGPSLTYSSYTLMLQVAPKVKT